MDNLGSTRCRAAAYLIAGAALAVLPGALGTATASAAQVPIPSETGCPAAMDLRVVSEMVAQGYLHIGGADVNGDGLICTQPLNPVVQEMRCADIGGCGVPILYYLRDNDLKAAR